MVLQVLDELLTGECRICGMIDILNEDGRCVVCWDKNIEEEFALNNNIGIQCKYCGGGKIVKKGFNDNNKQIYRCKDCNKRFVITEVIINEHPKVCFHCGSNATYRKSENKRYCKSCKRCYTVNRKRPVRSVI